MPAALQAPRSSALGWRALSLSLLLSLAGPAWAGDSAERPPPALPSPASPAEQERLDLPSPPTPAEQERLHQLAEPLDPEALSAWLQELEQRGRLSNWPQAGYYRALLAAQQGRGAAGLAELAPALRALSDADQAPAASRRTLLQAWQLKARLHQLLAEVELRDSAMAQAVAIADLALAANDPLRQWLHYEQLYHRIEAHRFSEAQAMAESLAASLPAPLERCEQALCLSLRFQMANMASSLGQLDAAYALSEQLAQVSQAPPHIAVWNLYFLISLAQRLQRPELVAAWCAQARRPQPQIRPDSEAHNALVRARAECTPPESAASYDALLHEEIQARGLGSQGMSRLLTHQANALLRQQRPAEAARTASQSWAIAWAKREPFDEWISHQYITFALAKQSRFAEAIFHAKLSIRAQQTLLRNAQDLPASQLEALLNNGREVYEELADWLIQARRLPEAERVLALGRQQGYHRLVRSQQPQLRPLEFTPEEQQRQARLEPLRQRLEGAWREREDRPEQLGPLLRSLAPTLQQPLSSRSAAVHSPVRLEPLPPGVTEVRLLPDSRQLHVMVRRHGQPDRQLRLAIPEAQLVQTIADFRRQLQQPGSRPQALAEQLYRQLWEPLQAWLPAAQPLAAAGAAPEIRLHLEGVLRYLPLASLHDGRHWLAESYALAIQPGAQAAGDQAPAPLQRQGWGLLGASQAAASLPALPLVRQEIGDIGRRAQAGHIPHSADLDADFTAEALRAALRSRRIVHLASHFRLVPGDGAASGLYLGDGSLLSLQMLQDPSYRFDGLELLTLSACETAIPSGPDNQEIAVDSLAWLAQARGARHVLASLWAVADSGTHRYMDAFYAALAQNMAHAQAVRAAQLALLRSTPGSQGGSTQRGLRPANAAAADLAHPYYWGGFVLLSGS